MKKTLTLLLAVILLFTLAACGSSAPDYSSAEELEAALNSGKDVTGKTVSFTVKEYEPASFFGYNMQAGEHLNFCSSSDPHVSAGDQVTVKVVEVEDLLGSYIISYEMK